MCLGAARRRADGCLQIVADAERRSLVGEGALPCAAVGPVRRGLDAMGLDGWERGFAYMRICDGGRVRGSVAGLRFVAPKNRGYLALRGLSALGIRQLLLWQGERPGQHFHRQLTEYVF